MIVAIDGPAGSGKSTTARAVAGRLDFLYLDTGAMYRAVALAFLREGAEATDDEAARLLPKLRVDVEHAEGGMHVFLDGQDVTDAIRRPEVGAMASDVGRLARVRAKLVAEQQRLGQQHAARGVVVDGRDIGTVVFPDADVKIFMDARAEERARRRQAELAGRGHEKPFEEVLAEIRQRDRQDRGRAIAPLRQAPDAVLLDTSALSFDEQVAFVVARVRERASDASV